MAAVNFAKLAEPVSDAGPCGPDLDLEGDPDFLNFMARIEGVLPSEFFERNLAKEVIGPFDRTKISFDKEEQSVAAFLERTRDLRLLVLQAKLSILNRNLADFSGALAAMDRLLTERWAEVHPQGDDGDYTLRLVTLQTLDDSASVVLPLQHLPLVQSRRFGPIHLRHILLRRGEAKALSFEDPPDDGAIAAAFSDGDFEALTTIRQQIRTARTALDRIQINWLQNAGSGEAVSFPKLTAILDRILEVLDGAVAQRDPGSALAQDNAPSGGPDAGTAESRGAASPVGAIRSAPEAAAALDAAAAYFMTHERSSLALLLVRQAQELVGRSFHEVIQALVPNHADQASVRIGVDLLFELPVTRLGEYLSDGAGANGAEVAEAATETEIPPDGEEVAADPKPAAEAPPQAPVTVARTRPEAIGLLEQVSAFYRVNEPASPIPLLVDRACGLSQKDFMSLLKDVLPGLKASSE